MINPASFRNLLFDFDGTLIDSWSLHDAAFRSVLQEEQPVLLRQFDYELFRGLSTADVFRRLGIVGEAEISRLSAEKQMHYRRLVNGGQLSPLPGALELLQASVGSGHRLFLVTSGSRVSVNAALTALEWLDIFEGVISADDVKQGKPSPEGFLLCLQRYGLVNTESIVFEDAEAGVVAARAANLSIAGVNNRGIESIVDRFFADLTILRTAVAGKSVEAM